MESCCGIKHYCTHRLWWKCLRPDGIHTEKHDNAILRHSWHSLRSNEKVLWAWFNSSQEQLFRVTYDGIHHGTRWKYMHSGTAWSWFEARWHSQRFMMEMWRGIYWEAWFHSLRIMMEILWHTVPHTHKFSWILILKYSSITVKDKVHHHRQTWQCIFIKQLKQTHVPSETGFR